MKGTISKRRELPKRGKKPTTYRPIVTGNVDRKSVIQSDEPLLVYEFTKPVTMLFFLNGAAARETARA
jgi:hypothetical protein